MNFSEEEKVQLKTIAQYIREGHLKFPHQVFGSMYNDADEFAACAMGCAAYRVNPEARVFTYSQNADYAWELLRNAFPVLRSKVSGAQGSGDLLWFLMGKNDINYWSVREVAAYIDGLAA